MINGVRRGVPSRGSAVAARPAASNDSMSPARSRGSEPLWQEVLRRAAVTLGRRAGGVWEADARGRLHLLASSSEDLAPLAGELEAALRTLGELPGPRPPPCRWVASRLEEQRWCIARVRRELPRPPLGVERRGRERVALELAGGGVGVLPDSARGPLLRRAPGATAKQTGRDCGRGRGGGRRARSRPGTARSRGLF